MKQPTTKIRYSVLSEQYRKHLTRPFRCVCARAADAVLRAFTGASVAPDSSRPLVFHYRPSYAEETDAPVRYLMKPAGYPRQIAVFAQVGPLWRCGISRCRKGMSALGLGRQRTPSAINYQRKPIDVRRRVNQLNSPRVTDAKRCGMWQLSGCRDVRREERRFFPGMIYKRSAVRRSHAAVGMTRWTTLRNGVISHAGRAAGTDYSSIVSRKKNTRMPIAKYFRARHPTTARWRVTFRQTCYKELRGDGPKFDYREARRRSRRTPAILDLGLGPR